MQAGDLQVFLHKRIPLSAAMGVAVRSATVDRVDLTAPLAPNVNHRDTEFGGSASAVAILAAWSVLYVRMRTEGLAGRIVIRRNAMSYERPIASDFEASVLHGRARSRPVLQAEIRRSHWRDTRRQERSAT